MSHVVLRPTTARPLWLRAMFDWFRQAKVAINLPHQNIETLSDRHLLDIGAGRKDIARAMDRDLGRLGLLDIGWQQPDRKRIGE